jgi:hypothetical protein
MSILSYFDKKDTFRDREYATLSEKYRPETIQEFMGNYKAIQIIHGWFASTNKRALLVSGPCGSGKTTLVDLFTKYYKKNVFVNCSNNKRSKKELTLWYEKIKNNTESVLIVDEMETLVTKNENMSISEISKWISSSTIRIIFISNSIVTNKMTVLKENPLCTSVVVEYPDHKTLFRKCMSILEQEKVAFDDERLMGIKTYIVRMNCDPRSIMDGLMISDLTCSEKDRDHDIYEAYQIIMDPEVGLASKMRIFGVDSGTIPVLFQENYIDTDLSLHERCVVSQSMSNADIFHKKIFMHTSNAYVEVYAAMSSIFSEMIRSKCRRESGRPRFGLIWTKQSAMCQKRKYLQTISQHLKTPFFNTMDYFYMHAYVKRIVDEFRELQEDLTQMKAFVDNYEIQNIEILFHIYVSFNVTDTNPKKTDTKPLTKKMFGQMFLKCFQKITGRVDVVQLAHHDHVG